LKIILFFVTIELRLNTDKETGGSEMENKNRMTKQDVQDLYNMITKKLKITYTVFDPVNATDPQALGVCYTRPGGTSKIQLNMPLIVRVYKEHKGSYWHKEFCTSTTNLWDTVAAVIIHELAHAAKHHKIYKLFPYLTEEMRQGIFKQDPDHPTKGNNSSDFVIRCMALMGLWLK